MGATLSRVPQTAERTSCACERGLGISLVFFFRSALHYCSTSSCRSSAASDRLNANLVASTVMVLDVVALILVTTSLRCSCGKPGTRAGGFFLLAPIAIVNHRILDTTFRCLRSVSNIREAKQAMIPCPILCCTRPHVVSASAGYRRGGVYLQCAMPSTIAIRSKPVLL